MRSRGRVLFTIVVVLALGCAGALLLATRRPHFSFLVRQAEPARPANAEVAAAGAPTVEITDRGLRLLTIGSVGEREFRRVVRDVGVIDFNQDLSTPVFPSYQGKIIKAFVDIGDAVEKGQVLYTIDSPDLVQAEQTLIQTAGVVELTNKSLARLRQSVRNGGGAQKDLDQAQSDQQTAAGSYNAARQALEVYGKTGADADRIIASRTIDPALLVKSPLSGIITARSAAPGMLVQPGTAPAPYNVADLALVRMYDYVSEDEVPSVHLGQSVTGRVLAYPGRVFTGKVTTVASAVDPNTHRLQVESLIPDPGHLLRPNMFVDLTIETGAPLQSTAVPTDAVVRLGDGTMTVWTTTDDRQFTQRTIRIGLQQDGFDQVLDGLAPGTRIVTKGAVFVSNIANANASP